MDGERVTVENFERAETNRMFASIQQQAGGINRWWHSRAPTPIDNQPVIRQNRDTLYSAAVVDISDGATLTIPDAGDRYLSVMVVNQDHYINHVYHAPGSYELTEDAFGTPFVLLAARILVDPGDPGDVTEVNALQDQLRVNAASDTQFTPPAYDSESFDATRTALLELARGVYRFDHAFGTRDEVDPIRHLLGTAVGWGGLPDREALYLNVDPGLPVGEYRLTVGEVPVDAFWSISLYNADGYFEPNSRDAYSVNSVTSTPNADGTVTVSFGVDDSEYPNYLPIMEGWNYTVRLYRPRPEILDGSWKFPAVEPR